MSDLIERIKKSIKNIPFSDSVYSDLQNVRYNDYEKYLKAIDEESAKEPQECESDSVKVLAEDKLLKENTHIVIKREDVDKYLGEADKRYLDAVLKSIAKNKGYTNTYYICNTDEPYAEKVLKAILDGEQALAERRKKNENIKNT